MSHSPTFVPVPMDFHGLPEYRTKEFAAMLLRFEREDRAKVVYEAMLSRARREYEQTKDRAWEECRGAWMAEGYKP